MGGFSGPLLEWPRLTFEQSQARRYGGLDDHRTCPPTQSCNSRLRVSTDGMTAYERQQLAQREATLQKFKGKSGPQRIESRV
jgi:hypothetical protein